MNDRGLEEPEEVTIERLTGAEKGEALGVLCAAFHDYPVMRYALKDAGSSYEQHLEALVDFFCEARLSRGWPVWGLRDEDELVAVALVSEPVVTPRPPSLQQVYVRLKETVGADTLARLNRYEETIGRGIPEGPHHYLGMIGVHPAHQGKGYGKHLMEAVKARAASDPVSTGVCLNTETAHNVPFYERRGFSVVFEADVDGLHTWCMFAACD